MGITGLLPFMEKASKKCNISEFSGYTVAVDTYCWLHKGAFSCADKIARGEFTDAHIKYCLKYVNMLLSHSIKPVLVFDGRHLPAKAMTELKRRESRNTAKKRAAELLRLGQTEEARSFMRRSVDITHEMALNLIQQCRQMNVDCIVAPYEADAQMAYLNKIKIAQMVITEDSDLVLFGCSKIFFKLDLNGNGTLVESAKLPLVMKCPLEHYDFNKFRQMCIMSGCDYLPSLPGIGLSKARQFINATRDPDIRNALRKLPSYYNKCNLIVTEEYRDGFMKAEATFKHQFVYDPLLRKLVRLNSLEDEGTEIEVCSNAGEVLDEDVAFQLAIGNLDPFSLKKMDDWHPDNPKTLAGGKTNSWKQHSIAPHKSIWSKDFSEHIKHTNSSLVKKEKCLAISIPTTRQLTSKVIRPINNENHDTGLSIENLSAMYCVKKPTKKHIVIEETQEFDDIKITESRNPFLKSHHDSPENKFNIDSCGNSSSRKRRLHSPERENSLSPKKESSPIIESRNRNYKKLIQSNATIGLNRISKFQRTTLDNTHCIESRFFSTIDSNCEDIEETKEESGFNVSGIAALNFDDLEKDNSKNHRLADTFHDENKPVDLIRSRSENLCESLKTFKKITNPFSVNNNLNVGSDTQSSYNENTYPLEDLVTPVASQMSTQSTEESQTTEQISSYLNQPISKNNGNINKAKSCRRPGLQRKSSLPVLSSQQSLLTNFGFFKKTQLKH